MLCMNRRCVIYIYCVCEREKEREYAVAARLLRVCSSSVIPHGQIKERGQSLPPSELDRHVCMYLRTYLRSLFNSPAIFDCLFTHDPRYVTATVYICGCCQKLHMHYALPLTSHTNPNRLTTPLSVCRWVDE